MKRIKQWSTSTRINWDSLSEEQKQLRREAQIVLNGETRICNQCFKEQEITEYWWSDKKKGKRQPKCRDCCLRNKGIVEVGKVRHALVVLDKGFRKCCDCKRVLPMHENFHRNENEFGGYSHICITCADKRQRKFQSRQQRVIGKSYVKRWAKENKLPYNEVEHYELYKEQIMAKRVPKYFCDGKDFVTLRDFARYIEEKYSIPITATENRMHDGAKEEECKLSDFQYRTLKSGCNKGRVEVTDTVTGEKKVFINTAEAERVMHIGAGMLLECIKSGLPTRIGNTSKYKNPCLVKRLL